MTGSSEERRRPLVELKGLVKRFGAVTAVDDVSLQVAEGEFLTFLGSSGSGKTTTLFIVAGFEDPTAGEVEIDGRSVLSVPANQRNIGMVFQRYTLFPHMSVAENVAFPLTVRGRPKEEVARSVMDMLELVRLEKLSARRPSELSGGQQQRVALARALVYKPRILLMDEPLAALDKRLREDLQMEIRRIHRDLGVTILYVTHDQEEALRMSDRIAVFSHGKIVQIGTGADLCESLADAFVAGFIGNSNMMTGTVVGSPDRFAEIALADGTVMRAATTQQVSVGSLVDVMIRPERLRISESAGDGEKAGVQRIAVKVTDVTYLGETLQYEVMTGWNQSMTVRSQRHGVLTGIGDDLVLEFSEVDALVFTR